MKLLVIVDNLSVARWQARALELLPGFESVEILSCRNTRIRRKVLRHALYYALNSFTIRNPWTSHIPVSELEVPIAAITEFDSEYDGAWQRLPPQIIDRMRGSGAEAIIKFGMSLLRVPDGVDAPILSYHHGDPAVFRGRPAGFWETLQRRRVVGQVVQIICDRLDAGAVVAFAQTKVFPYSYRSTMMEAYRHSPLLLRSAVKNALAGTTLDRDRGGRNYRLPGNWTVARLVAGMGSALLKRLFYGVFYEKRWSVSTAPASVAEVLNDGGFPARTAWRDTVRSDRHSFHADPFFCDSPQGILVEAMNRSTGKGELALLDADGSERILSDPARHHSYPATIVENGKTYVIPEVATWSAPQIMELSESGLVPVAELQVEGCERIVDPTIFRAPDGFYLFGNRKRLGTSTLCLWWSPSLFERFIEHPASPVLISPAGGRMAGSIVKHGDSIYRFGQDCSGAYGDGVLIFRIDRLSRDEYREEFVRKIRFADVSGPHTINFSAGRLLFDWYRGVFHPLAWLGRLRSL